MPEDIALLNDLKRDEFYARQLARLHHAELVNIGLHGDEITYK